MVLPATRTLALVEFRERAAAQHAFRSLAYKAFQHVPLFLEWAPEHIFLAASDAALPTVLPRLHLFHPQLLECLHSVSWEMAAVMK